MEILVAHADAAARAALAERLDDQGFTVVEAADGETARGLLRSPQGPRVALLDWDLPGVGGPDACRLVREDAPSEAPYLVVMIPAAHRGDVAEVAAAGADDVVLTPVTGDELRARVTFAAASVEARSVGAGEQERTLRCFDPVTFVLDRAQLVIRLEEELARSRRERVTLGIGILDIDGLRAVNEECGREAGDEVLREVARRLTSTLRPYDVVGRLEDDEFLVITHRTEELDVAEALQRVRRAMIEKPFCHGDDCLAVTVTVGGVTGAEESAEELIALARTVLAEAKQAGGDRVMAGAKVVLESVLTNRWSS